MKKLLTIALVYVYALALVFALGCTQKEEAATEESGMEQTMPEGDMGMGMDSTSMNPDTTTTTTTTETVTH
jgi:hypothetical protein